MIPNWLHLSLFVATQLAMLVGLLGLVVPFFPGIVVIWLAALLYGIVEGFSSLGIGLFVFITLLMLAGTTVDNVFMAYGTRKGGAAWSSVILAQIAGLVGAVLLSPLGGLVVSPLAALALEYRRLGDWQQSWQAVRGMAAGWGLSFIARLAIGFVMMAGWWLWVWKG